MGATDDENPLGDVVVVPPVDDVIVVGDSEDLGVSDALQPNRSEIAPPASTNPLICLNMNARDIYFKFKA